MEDILIAKLIATSAKQIGMFLVILAVVTAAIVAFIIYTMTLAKVREIAVLKLIGAQEPHHRRHDPAAGARRSASSASSSAASPPGCGGRPSRNTCCCCRATPSAASPSS